MNTCTGSGKLSSVSDFNVLTKHANCPVCHQKVRITIPDRKMHANRAKFAKHRRDNGRDN